MGRKSIAGCAIAAVVLVGTLTGIATWAAGETAPATAVTSQGAANHPLRRVFFESLRRLQQLSKDLNLTADQKTKIGGILKSHKSEIVGALQALNTKHQALLNAVRADTVNEAAIRAASKDLGDVIADASILRAKVRLEIRAVLTPDQCKLVDQALDQIGQSVTDALNALANQQ